MFLFIFAFSLILSVVFTPLLRMLAIKGGVQDFPAPPRKGHRFPTPLLGGAAIFLSFFITSAIIIIVFQLDNFITFNYLDYSFPVLLTGILLAGFLLIIGGILDDVFNLPPKYQIIWPIAAAITVIATGLGHNNISNPMYVLGLSKDPLIHLEVIQIPLLGGNITLFTDVFTFVWLMVLMYATKFLDGLNGLVSGITFIGGMILFFTSLALGQPIAAVFALIVAGSFAGFLPYNFFGKIFLGEGGSILAGFLLGVLALIGPAKISITFLVLGIPILDVFWVVYQRVVKAKKSPFTGDLRHLHFKLIERGLSSRQSVAILWLVSLVFGFLGLRLQGFGDAMLLFAILIVMVIFIKITSKKRTIDKTL